MVVMCLRCEDCSDLKAEVTQTERKGARCRCKNYIPGEVADGIFSVASSLNILFYLKYIIIRVKITIKNNNSMLRFFDFFYYSSTN